MSGPSTPLLNHRSRLLLLAPHPDDESLACGVLLQRAREAGARIRVAYVTDGENNPWPQRALERKWRLDSADRQRWGEIRRGEAIAALGVLGVDRSEVQFLGLPDQGLTRLLLSGSEEMEQQLAECIRQCLPTHILVPDLADTHPDHSAISLVLETVVQNFSTPANQFSIWNFLVHGHSAIYFQRAAAFPQTPAEKARKLAAIACHQTQLLLSRRRFMAYAQRPERIALRNLRRHPSSSVPVNAAQKDVVALSVPAATRKFMPGRSRLFIVGRNEAGRAIRACTPVDNAGTGKIVDCGSKQPLGNVEVEGNILSGLRITLPPALVSRRYPLYVKLQRPGIFFDSAGWVAIHDLPEPVTESANEPSAELSLAVA